LNPFLAGLFLLSAASLMYQVILTRLLSVTAWYYLAFVAISMSMFGLTLGALLVQLRPALFPPDAVRLRTAQAAAAMGVALPLALVGMLAVPLEISLSIQTFFSFVIFSAIVSVPLVFSGTAVCLALTRYGRPFGSTYAVDLAGAAAGCLGALGLLTVLDAPSALLAVSALVFLAAALLTRAAGSAPVRRHLVASAVLMVLAILNASTLYGIQPIWAKGAIDRRDDILAEAWNPISRVRAHRPQVIGLPLWGPSPVAPPGAVVTIQLDIDNDAATGITRFGGDASSLGFVRYDVVSVPAELRAGGSMAIIGLGGGRDVLTAAYFGFRRIVGIEVNPAILDLMSRRYADFSGMAKIQGLELHLDEGRSYLTRTPESFDVIQATLVDTWAGTAAGAMALTENSLYTVDAWRLFYRRLKPGGLIAFTRWHWRGESYQSRRLFSLGFAALLAEGVERPGEHLALLTSGDVATLMASNAPLSPVDLARLRAIVDERRYEPLYLPGTDTKDPVLARIAAAHDLADLRKLRNFADVDYSPPTDDSPFFFNALRFTHLIAAVRAGDPVSLLGVDTLRGGNLRALGFLMLFLLAASVLVVVTILWPLRQLVQVSEQTLAVRAVGYFTALGLGFMLAEIGMMQQLGIVLGHPVYALVVVLAGLILFTGAGSLLSERAGFHTGRVRRVPALLAAAALGGYLAVLPQVTRSATGGSLGVRALICLGLLSVPGLLMGLCFPAGVRAMHAAGWSDTLPWMWALNGAASVLATFAGIIVAMEYGLTACIVSAAACYTFGALALGGPRLGARTLPPQRASERTSRS
jgi:SAM-dependent methyltransferase